MGKYLIGLFLFLVSFYSFGVLADSEASVDELIHNSAITVSVKSKMAEDKLVSALDIKVKTDNGIVFLEGHVKSNAEANRAIELASSVSGVVDVDTAHLYVQGSNHPLNDSMITAKIKGAYLREKVFGASAVAVTRVHVETNDGIVYLTGEVDNQAQAENVERLAQLVQGVRQVKSNISVKDK